MKRSFKEKLIDRLKFKSRRNKWLKPFILPVLFVVFLFQRTGTIISRNYKRYCCIFMVLLFFFMCSSFSFSFISGQEISDTSLIFLTEEAVLSRQNTETDNSVKEEQQTAAEEAGAGYENDYPEQPADDTDGFAISADEILANNFVTSGYAEEEDEDDGIFSKDDWKLILINKQHPLPDNYEVELGEIKGGMKCDARVLDSLFAMLKGARDSGMGLVVCSPYRPQSRQEMLFNRKIDTYMGRGLSYMDAYREASQWVTVPGTSEHQAGLAFDIVCNTYSSLNSGFGETKEGRWLAEHAHEYGFVMRYPLGKEYITGIKYEPWHFRYVGRSAAEFIKERDICLEEFWDII